MCDINDDHGRCEVWTETTRKARKDYACDCCRGAIAKGEQYVRIFMVSDGCASTERECSACADVVIEFKKHHNSWSSPSGMEDLVQQCYEEESRYEDDDERIPTSAMGALWKRELEAMSARRSRRLSALLSSTATTQPETP